MEKFNLTEKKVSEENPYSSSVFKIKKMTIILPNGQYGIRDIVEHNGGVCVVALDDNKDVYLVEQYRMAMDRVVLEIPAGKLELGEKPDDAIKRELKEETGLDAKNWVFLGSFYPTPGYSTEIIYVYLATGLTQGGQCLDPDEFLNVKKMSFDEAFSLVMDNGIKDGKTVYGLMRTKLYIENNGERDE